MPPKRSKASQFPAARIKRIMQQDDDIAKAVELFLQDMVQAVEKEARQKGTRKVTLYHVKRAVLNTRSLDFLKDLVASIPDPAGADEDDEPAPKQRKPRASAAKKAEAGSSKNGGTSTSSQVKSEFGGPSVLQQPPGAQSYYSPSSSTAPQVKEEQPERRVAIPISSLLGPSGDDDPYSPSTNGIKKEEPELKEEQEESKDVEPSVLAQPVSQPYTRPTAAEDEDYDEE